MKKKVTPVTVNLTTVITQEGQTERFSFTEAGQFVELNGKYYLRYTEHQEGQATPVRFRFEDPLVWLQRSGVVETNLEFDLTKSTRMRYQTAYGTIILDVATTELVQELDADRPAGHVRVSYQLKNAGIVVGTYQLELQFAA